jgi:hypothetical protein
MSFFDEGDEPTRATRPRRPAAPRPRGGGGGGRDVDNQTLMVRRAVALGGGLIVLLILIFGVRGCLNSQKKRGLKDYNRDVTSLVSASDSEVAKPFFQQFNGGSADALDLETNINQLAATADDLVKRARKLSTPGPMKQANSHLILVLELRRDALSRIATKVRTALSSGSGASKAVAQIAGQMSAFLASDVVYSQRVFPEISTALSDNSVGGQKIPQSRFLPDIAYLNEAQVAARLGASVSAGHTSGAIAPGTHGHGLETVSVGNVTLQPGTVANRIPAGSGLVFAVKFQNQGENDEFNVNVKVTLDPTGAGKTQTVTKKVPTTRKGTETTADVALKQAPPIGTPVTITVDVGGVPGEKNLTNNKNTYEALFTTS